jgi:hypothetical protein
MWCVAHIAASVAITAGNMQTHAKVRRASHKCRCAVSHNTVRNAFPQERCAHVVSHAYSGNLYALPSRSITGHADRHYPRISSWLRPRKARSPCRLAYPASINGRSGTCHYRWLYCCSERLRHR